MRNFGDQNEIVRYRKHQLSADLKLLGVRERIELMKADNKGNMYN